MLYVATVLTASIAVAFAEQLAFGVPQLYVGLIAMLLGVNGCLRWIDRLAGTARIELDLDEQLASPTQRFSLERF